MPHVVISYPSQSLGGTCALVLRILSQPAARFQIEVLRDNWGKRQKSYVLFKKKNKEEIKIMSSRQNPLHLSSCYCYGYRFWGGLLLSRVLWKSAYSRSNMKPKSIPKQLGNGSISCFVGFRWFGNTSCSFHVAFICMHVPKFSFHLHASSFHCAFISFHFLSLVFISIHVPFIFLSCSFQCIHVLSSSFHVHACSFHFAFMSFHFLSKVMEMAFWLGQGTECSKWLSLSYR